MWSRLGQLRSRRLRRLSLNRPDQRLDRLNERLDQLNQDLHVLSYEIRHNANLRFDSVDARQLGHDHELARLRLGLAETREALVESTAYLTRALREAGRLVPPDTDTVDSGDRDKSGHESRDS